MARLECNMGLHPAEKAPPENSGGKVDRSELRDTVAACRPKEARTAELGMRPSVRGCS